jgi:hypothetical protein
MRTRVGLARLLLIPRRHSSGPAEKRPSAVLPGGGHSEQCSPLLLSAGNSRLQSVPGRPTHGLGYGPKEPAHSAGFFDMSRLLWGGALEKDFRRRCGDGRLLPALLSGRSGRIEGRSGQQGPERNDHGPAKLHVPLVSAWQPIYRFAPAAHCPSSEPINQEPLHPPKCIPRAGPRELTLFRQQPHKRANLPCLHCPDEGLAPGRARPSYPKIYTVAQTSCES